MTNMAIKMNIGLKRTAFFTVMQMANSGKQTRYFQFAADAQKYHGRKAEQGYDISLSEASHGPA